MKDPMYEPIVTISWCAADVKAIRENWSNEQCIEALERVGRWFEDRSIELGWETLEIHLNLEYGYEDENEDAQSLRI